MQINRLLEIVYVLLFQKTATAKELAERFQVSQRTIYRDIDALSLAGIPVYTEKGRGGGISLLPDFVLNKSILSEQEQNEILSALHGLSVIHTAGVGQVLQKLSAVFNKTAAPWLEVDFSDWGYGNRQLFNDFKTAILARRVVEFDYYNAQGEMMRRRVEPQLIWFKSKAWYVKGFCLTRMDGRVFKLTRVRNLIATGERFAARDASAPSLPKPPARRPIPFTCLTLRIAADMAYRVYDEFCEDSVSVEPDGSFLVAVTWPEDEWVYGTILSYGEKAEVLEPEHIRDIIRDRASGIVARYTPRLPGQSARFDAPAPRP
jgi:predicted DNA-binding transcriptional regulator YafY